MLRYKININNVSNILRVITHKMLIYYFFIPRIILIFGKINRKKYSVVIFYFHLKPDSALHVLIRP